MRSNRRLFAILLVYSVAVGISYALPVGLTDGEWYSFYSYLDSTEATPYVEVREGYPPIGFLIYMPLYLAFRGNEAAFSYGFRAVNGSFLVATLYVLYLTAKSVGGESKGIKTALYYAVLPSVVIANAYSNDVVALLPAVLAIYMMQKRKAAYCGILLGLATLSKGFPILLLIPALIAFKDAKDKVKLVGATSIMLVFVSLPFMIANPFTYLSTFTHHGSRGPWETVWALAEGYHSHGGLLHPYFDKFFYHFNLLKMYPASPSDHAIYAWNSGLMPNLLTFCQIGAVSIFSLTYKRIKDEAVSLSGLLYISYMLFFQGYSTQFSVSTPLYLLLAVTNHSLIFLIPLELSHILQLLSWNSQFFGPEVLRDAHLPMLVFAVVLRSIVFAVLIVNSLRSRFSLKQAAGLIRSCFGYLKLFKDELLVLLVSATVVLALISSAMLCGYLGDSESFRSFDGRLHVTQSEWQNINIDGLQKGDQVMVRLVTNTWLDAELADSTVQVERSVRNPFHLKDSFNETVLFFVADSESHSLMLRMKHPKMPFRVTDGLDGDLKVNVTSGGSSLLLNLLDEGTDGKDGMLRIAYPYSGVVGDDFRLSFKYNVSGGEVSNVLLDVFDDTDEWQYTFVAPEEFVLNPDTMDVHGHSNLQDDNISLVAIVISLEDGASAVFTLEEFTVSGGESWDIQFYAEADEEIGYEVFIERDFKPSVGYVVSLASAAMLGVVVLYQLHRRAKCVPGEGLK